MKTTYKEIRKIGSSDLRLLCIRNKWFTCVDKYQFIEFSKKVDGVELSTELIVELATIIYNHSELDNYYTQDEHLENIMFLIAKFSITLFEKV